LYAELVDLYERGERLAEATARCAVMGSRGEAGTLVALNEGSTSAPRLTSDGVAAVLRFRVGYIAYLVELTPDPRRAAELARPIPAEPILHALKAAGYSVLGARRMSEGLTHGTLARRSGLHRRKIGRICDGTVTDLTVSEVEALLDAIDRPDLWHELVEPYLAERAEYDLRLEDALEEIYEELAWLPRCAQDPTDQDSALSDFHERYNHWQHQPEIARLPAAERRARTAEWFGETHGRPPHAIPDSLRDRALSILALRQERYVEDAARARKEIGPPERITGSRVRDVTRRACDRGLLPRGQRPREYPAPDTPAEQRFDRTRAHRCEPTGRSAWSRAPAADTHKPMSEQAVRARAMLDRADRGLDREVAELRILRAAAELPRESPRRAMMEERFTILAAKGSRRALFRKSVFASTTT